ncbi:MAG: UDP-N-acetylmuramate dehydrogenase [Opitutales bacterium]|nr:UDP-N-acetylmuramate dehydrogenase [Opitutales bacterium]
MQTDLPIDVPAQKVWLLGMGGMGVGPLALYMREEGWKVSGWDDGMEQSALKPFLIAAGTTFEAFPSPDVVLAGRSSAIKPGHPLYERAASANLRLLRRGEVLAERMASKKLVAVCGSHGKTTTSGMLAQSLRAAGTDAGYVLGGLYKNPDLAPANCSATSPWTVAEVDESDGTIGAFSPQITVTVNLDWDHPDYYRDESELDAVFRALYERTREAVFVPADNARLQRLTQGLRVPVMTVGDNGDYRFNVLRAGADSTTVELGGRFGAGTVLTLPVIGRFNTLNAMLALAVTDYISGGHIDTAFPLGKFNGMRRRQDLLFAGGGMKIFADYAHHPTEIAALLKLLRETQLGTLTVVFQPHRYSRTRQYAAEFARALSIADRALLVPVYSAGEAPVAGGEASSILQAAAAGSNLTLCESFDEAAAILQEQVTGSAPRTIAFVGAGDIDRKLAVPFARECWLRDLPFPSGEDFVAQTRAFLSPETVFGQNRPLAPLTTLGVGGNARFYAEPASLNDLSLLLRAAAAGNIEIFILGRGSNLLVADEGFDGLVIRLSPTVWQRLTTVQSVSGGKTCVRIGAGVRLKELCGFAARERLTGFEFLCGIPGTLGGALRMNAGAHGSSIFDRVVSIEWMTPDGTIHSAPRERFSPVYRDCPQLHGAIILAAVLESAGTAPSEEINANMKAFSIQRAATQPQGRSAGCTFKNPAGDSAGRLIDSLGLKGLSVGKARVSELHANFILAAPGASANDVRTLIRRVQGRVEAETGLRLQPEIEFLGFSTK